MAKNVGAVLRGYDVALASVHFAACFARRVIYGAAHLTKHIVDGDFRIVKIRYSPFDPDAGHRRKLKTEPGPEPGTRKLEILAATAGCCFQVVVRIIRSGSE